MQQQRIWTEIDHLAAAAEVRGGVIGVAVIGPDGSTYARNGDRSFRAASTIKIGVMIALYRQIDRGERAVTDTVTLTDLAKTPGSGVLLHLHDGITLTLGDLLYLMMSISDNTATNILIELVGMAGVNATLRELGLRHSVLARPMRGRPAATGEPENWATPAEFAALVRCILDHQAASAAACDAMIELLRAQQNGRRIGRYVPHAAGVTWGSKTGSIAGVTNDAGFIRTPSGTLIIAVYCEDLPDQHSGEKAIGDITRAAMQATNIAEPLLTS